MTFLKLPNFFKMYQLRNYKFLLAFSVISISVLGVFVIGSAKESVQMKQLYGLLFGLVVMVIASLLDYTWVLNFYWIIYGVIVALLVIVKLFGTEYNGSKRWIDIGFTFQPSELVKILLILFMAKYIMIHHEDLNQPRTLVKMIGLGAVPLVLIYLQPDMSTTLSIAIVFFILLYIGGLSYRFIGTVLAIIIPVSIIFLSIVVQPNQHLIKEYQQKRILAWLEPEKYSTDDGYQQQNSIMAIGSGQLNGKGLNNNTTTSVKNGNYIVEPETDFIFAIVGEELGFIGACAVIGLLLMIIILCIVTGIKAQDLAGRLICCGVAAQIGFQGFINICVATGVFPNTGIPLPFVSYGLTSLVSFFIGIGFVLNVGLQPKKY